MNYGIKLKKINKNLFLKIYMFAGAVTIMILVLFVGNQIVRNIKKEAQIIPDLFSQFIKYSGEENIDNHFEQYILENVITKIEYPIIVTDQDKKPQFWKNLKIPEDVSYNDLDSQDKKTVDKFLFEMEKKKWFIPIKYNNKENRIIGYTYFSESNTLKMLRYLPYVELSIILLFVVLGFYGYVLIKKREKDRLWVGLAKETAHQFGTPITSLLGWISVLKGITNRDFDDEYVNMLNYMEADILRLQKVASRFGKVGSTIKLISTNLDKHIVEIVNYFQKKTPVITNSIIINYESYIKDQMIDIDIELFSWTLENIIKNSIDAMKGKSGEIVISSFRKNNDVSILIKDQGKGISKSILNKIFEPGTTTKNRGWGLGLSLAKRIIEEYHKGKIRVVKSVPGNTVFEILIPIKQKIK